MDFKYIYEVYKFPDVDVLNGMTESILLGTIETNLKDHSTFCIVDQFFDTDKHGVYLRRIL